MVPDGDGPSKRTMPPLRSIDLSKMRQRYAWVLTMVTAASAALIWLGGFVSGVDVLGGGVSQIQGIISPQPSPTPVPSPTPAPPAVLAGNLSELRFRTRNVPLGVMYEAENHSIPKEYQRDLNQLGALLNYRAEF